MTAPETSIPFDGAPFRSTAWTVIREAQDEASPQRGEALERLIRVYWRPVYWTLRLDWNGTPEEAKDLTQEYFAVFLEKDMIGDVAPERGRFRAYVKATLKNFMLSRRRAERTLKRGGGRKILPLEDLAAVEANAVVKAEPPDKRFERELYRSIVLEARRALAEECRREGKAGHVELFEAYYLAEDAGQTVRYEDLCQRFNVSLHDIKNRLAELRDRLRQIILDTVRDGVSSPQELTDEIREIFGL